MPLQLSGSLNVSGSVTAETIVLSSTASLAGTASWADYVVNGGGFPYSGSAVVTGSVSVSSDYPVEVQLLSNPSFDGNANGWVLGADVVYYNNNISCSFQGNNYSDSEASTEFPVQEGVEYNVTLTLSNVQNDTMYAYIQYDFVQLDEIGNGTWQINFTSSYTGTNYFGVGLWNGNVGATYILENAYVYCTQSPTNALTIGGDSVLNGSLSLLPRSYQNQLLKNPDFNGNADFWTLGINTFYYNNSVSASYPGGSPFGVEAQSEEILFTSGSSYTASITVSSLNTVNGNLYFGFVTNPAASYIYSSGTYELPFTSDSTGTDRVSFSLQGADVGDSFVVDSVRLYIDAKEGGNLTVNGSVISTVGFTGSLEGTASWAQYVVNSGAGFPYSGSAVITGSLAQGSEENLTIGDYSHAEGYQTLASGSYSHAEGQYTTSSGIYCHSEGQLSQATGEACHAEGWGTIASNYYSHAEGEATQALGAASHAEGVSTYTSGYGAHAEGLNVSASGNHSHAEGSYNNSVGASSHAEGYQTLSSGSNSHSEGYQTVSSGSYSHAEGFLAISLGEYSHAEGNGANAIGISSHAEGASSVAQGDASHAEGQGTIASGVASHAEGYLTIAAGLSSHAEGYITSASGDFSHAEGYATIASGSYQHVQGKFNQISTENYAFIIGNGISDNSRSNLVFALGSTFQVTGSVISTGGFTGSLFGSASYYPVSIIGDNTIVSANTSNTDDFRSIILGRNAGKDTYSTLNQRIILIGEDAATLSYGCNGSVAIGGSSAMYAAKYSNDVVAIGSTVASEMISSSYSVSIGYLAGERLKIASESVSIGTNANRNALLANNTIAIGSNANRGSVSSSYSIFIGNYAGYVTNNLSTPSDRGRKDNNIVIGNYCDVGIATSNAINVGGLIFGSGSYSQKTVSSGSANGRIGINQPNPQYSLDVSGSIGLSDVLVVATRATLPVTAPTGSIMASGSGADNKPYYWNGATWTALF